MKTVGIIGGLGPETTSQFYLEVIFSCYKKSLKARPPILIWSIPLEYQIEDDLLTRAEGEERYIPYLVEAAERLEAGGADFIVIPCNSVHLFIDEVRQAIKIPVVSIIEETSNFLKEKGIKRIGLLATKSTVEKKLYQSILNKEGVEIVLPDARDQERIGILIRNIVLNRHDDKDRNELLTIIEKLGNKGITSIVLACTDLQLLIRDHKNLSIFDSMKILANTTVETILG